jgi:hypothetical protein
MNQYSYNPTNASIVDNGGVVRYLTVALGTYIANICAFNNIEPKEQVETCDKDQDKDKDKDKEMQEQIAKELEILIASKNEYVEDLNQFKLVCEKQYKQYIKKRELVEKIKRMENYKQNKRDERFRVFEVDKHIYQTLCNEIDSGTKTKEFVKQSPFAKKFALFEALARNYDTIDKFDEFCAIYYEQDDKDNNEQYLQYITNGIIYCDEEDDNNNNNNNINNKDQHIRQVLSHSSFTF